MGEEGGIPLIQVTNVSPRATDQQMRELFSYLGSIKELKVYPERCVTDRLSCKLPLLY